MSTQETRDLLTPLFVSSYADNSGGGGLDNPELRPYPLAVKTGDDETEALKSLRSGSGNATPVRFERPRAKDKIRSSPGRSAQRPQGVPSAERSHWQLTELFS